VSDVCTFAGAYIAYAGRECKGCRGGVHALLELEENLEWRARREWEHGPRVHVERVKIAKAWVGWEPCILCAKEN
jgi:hypothetical protein